MKTQTTEYTQEQIEDVQRTHQIIQGIATKYAKLIEKRIDNTDNLSSEDIHDLYDGFQSLGHIIASMERLERIKKN